MDIIRQMLMQEDSGNTEEELPLKVKSRQTLTFSLIYSNQYSSHWSLPFTQLLFYSGFEHIIWHPIYILFYTVPELYERQKSKIQYFMMYFSVYFVQEIYKHVELWVACCLEAINLAPWIDQMFSRSRGLHCLPHISKAASTESKPSASGHCQCLPPFFYKKDSTAL